MLRRKQGLNDFLLVTVCELSAADVPGEGSRGLGTAAPGQAAPGAEQWCWNGAAASAPLGSSWEPGGTPE